MNIYVSGLSFTSISEDLTKLFSAYGTVSTASVIMDKFTNRSKGFGFVEMNNEDEGANAIKQLDGTQFDGRSIRVSVARPKEDRSTGRNNFSKGLYSNNRLS